MQTRAFWMFGIALLMGSGAVVVAGKLINKEPKAVVVKEDTTPIVVAKARLDFGIALRKEHLSVVPWPSKLIPEGTFSSIDELLGKGEDRVALRPIEVNEPILKSKVSGFGGRASLSAVIDKDMRAATIRVNDVNGVAGFVLPADRVDVLLTRDPEASPSRATRNQDLVTSLLLQNVKVLAVDQDANSDKSKPSVAKAVTLEVTSTQAQKLVLAQQVGSLALALRNVDNLDATAERAVRVRDLHVGEVNDAKSETPKSAAKPSAPTHTSTVKIVRGLQESVGDVLLDRPTGEQRVLTAPAQRSDRGQPTRASDKPPAGDGI